MTGPRAWWRARRARRRVRELVGTTVGKLGCDACGENEAVYTIPSRLEDRDVLMCEFCYRRWRRANELYAIPKKRRKRK